MTPRVGISLAGAGALIAVGGAVGLGGDQLVGDDGDVQRIPGVLIALALIAAGGAALRLVRTGPVASAGATAAALGVPVLLFFLTFDVDDFPPVSLDAVLAVSSIAWLAAYVVGPGAGRLFFLGLALAGSWLFVVNLVEPIEQLTPFGAFSASTSSSFSEELSTGEMTFDEEGNPVFDEEFGDFESFDESDVGDAPFGFDAPDFTDVGIVSLLFGAAYALAGFVLSRRGYDGAGTPFAAVSIAAIVVGIQAVAPELEQVGTGVLAMVLGVGLAGIGSASKRRATAWIGAAIAGLGAIAVVQKGVEDASATGQSLAFLFIGLAVVCAAQLLTNLSGELAEEDERRSFRREPPRPASEAQAAQEPDPAGPAPVHEIDLDEE